MLLRTLLSRELILLGVKELRAHRLRSFLTTLGMIFGVGAVICMLSIGEGASAEQLESIRLLGSQNIIVRSVQPPASQSAREETSRLNKYGITEIDVQRLRELPHVKDIVLMREVADIVTRGSRKFEGKVLGATDNLFRVLNVRVGRGRSLAPLDGENRRKVCVIGANVAATLFQTEDPLGKHIDVQSRGSGTIPYEVVGVLESVQTAGSPEKGVQARNINSDVYIPQETADARYGEVQFKRGRGTFEARSVQFSDIYIHVDATENVMAVSNLVKRVFEHGHKEQDYEVSVPLALLQKAERDKALWQMVLGSIAGISLLVGGIGIMNIMLASVTERTREIGIRRALGAKRAHITAQFLIETLILSISGGLLGVLLGIAGAAAVAQFTQFQAIIPWWGVALSFVVSAMVGIAFGLYPARSAAELDPIEALRHE